MANHISRGEPIFIPFKDGKTVSDSQNKARMYKTKRAFEKSFPKLDVAIEKVELVEYAEVRHGRWVGVEYDGYADGFPVYNVFECSECGYEHKGEYDTLTSYCPDCAAKMDAEG